MIKNKNCQFKILKLLKKISKLNKMRVRVAVQKKMKLLRMVHYKIKRKDKNKF